MDSTITWKSGMAFDASLDGFHFTIDAGPEHGGKGEGPSPKGLVLSALAGCTAMDVISILQKMRQDVRGLAVTADGALAEEHPKRFTTMVLRYAITGENLDLEKVKRAVSLSQERYCGVYATLAPTVAMSSEIEVNGTLVS